MLFIDLLLHSARHPVIHPLCVKNLSRKRIWNQRTNGLAATFFFSNGKCCHVAGQNALLTASRRNFGHHAWGSNTLGTPLLMSVLCRTRRSLVKLRPLLHVRV